MPSKMNKVKLKTGVNHLCDSAEYELLKFEIWIMYIDEKDMQLGSRHKYHRNNQTQP